MTKEKEREHCATAVGATLNTYGFDEQPLIDLLMRERQAVRAEMYMELTQAAHAQIELKAQLDTAREQRDTYYAGMKEAKAQLVAVNVAQLIKNLEHERTQKHAAQVALTQLRTAAEGAYEYLIKHSIARTPLDRAAELRAALDSTKPTSEPAPRGTFDPAKVRELLVELGLHIQPWQIRDRIKALRDSEVKLTSEFWSGVEKSAASLAHEPDYVRAGISARAPREPGQPTPRIAATQCAETHEACGEDCPDPETHRVEQVFLDTLTAQRRHNGIAFECSPGAVRLLADIATHLGAESEPERALARAEAHARRGTFDADKVRELCDYATSQRFENSIKLKGFVQAVRDSEVKP